MVSRQDSHPSAWPALMGAALRVAFGLIWVVNAAFTWTAQFSDHFVGYLHNAADGQPAWSAFWFAFWIWLVTPQAGLFIWATRIIETLLALALLFGFARKYTYICGLLFSLLIWSTAEGFGGPYAVGATNMGAAIVYVLLFVALMTINYRAGTSPYSLDYLIEQVSPGWRRLAEFGRADVAQPMRRVSWGVQAPVLVGIAVLVFFLVAGLQSSLNVKAPSPQAAAAAVSPLALAKGKVEAARDATLPPVPAGDVVEVHIDASDDAVSIAAGVSYQAWTFNGTVPGPVIHARQGQTIKVTLTNSGTMHHSVDFHSAQTPPSLDYVDIMPGEKLEFEFVAKVAGAFVYHCGTDPVLLHMANGMYGAMIVDPAAGLPPADKSYVLVQSEWYTKQISGTLMGGDFQKMLASTPDEVVFNGVANQYADHPLPARAGERVRLYVVNAGPNQWSAFHVIGAIFESVYPDGNPAHALHGVQTWSVPPGAGAVFDVVMDQPGRYPFVDHDFSHLTLGAHGILDVRDAQGNSSPKPNITRADGAAPAATTAPAEASGPYTFDAERATQHYAATCAACHQASGEGMAGVFPPLKGDAVVLDADPTAHIQAILHGVSGKTIDGVTYPAPMPPFGSSLSDADVADIVNHERSSWGNEAKHVTPGDVAAQR